MGILSTIVGGGVAEPIKAVGGVLDSLFTSDEERLDKQEALTRLAQRPNELQAAINQVEAQHRSIFVAGWRPFIGWVCGFALAWHFMLYDFLTWVSLAFFPTIPPLPALTGTETLISVVMSLLGLGALRTVEKLQGRSK